MEETIEKSSYVEGSTSTKGVMTFKIKRYVNDDDAEFEKLKEKVKKDLNELRDLTLASQ